MPPTNEWRVVPSTNELLKTLIIFRTIQEMFALMKAPAVDGNQQEVRQNEMHRVDFQKALSHRVETAQCKKT